MNRAAIVSAALAALACASSCAPVEEPAAPIAGLSTERQCFFTDQIDGYGDAPDGPRGNRIRVSTGPNDRWLLETFGPCPELDWTFHIALETRPGSNLCTGRPLLGALARQARGAALNGSRQGRTASGRDRLKSAVAKQSH